MGKTIEELMKEIQDDTGKDQYSFGALFQNLQNDDDELLEGNCLLFSMNETIAKALNEMRGALPEGSDSVRISFPKALTLGVRYVTGGQDNELTPIAKGYLDDSLIDDGYYPDDNFIRVTRDAVAIEVEVEDPFKEIQVKGIAEFPGDLLLIEVREAKNTSQEKMAELAEGLFTDTPVSSMSPR